MLFNIRCTKHPTYKCIKYPTSECFACTRLFLDSKSKSLGTYISFSDGSSLKKTVVTDKKEYSRGYKIGREDGYSTGYVVGYTDIKKAIYEGK